MKRKILVILMALLLAISLVASGCPAPAPVAPPPVAPPPVPETITMSTYLTPSYEDLDLCFTNFQKEINERAEGKVVVDFHHSGTLFKAKEQIGGLLDGTADIVIGPTIYIQSTYPILGFLSLPFIWEDVEHFGRAVEIDGPLDKLINSEMEKGNIYMIMGAGDTQEHLWLKKVARQPADLKGRKIRCSGLLASKEVESYGAVPISMPSAELYLALERGIVEGAFASWMTSYARTLYEVTDYVILAPWHYYGSMDLYFRADWWNGLPKDIRDIILEAGRHYQSDMLRETPKYSTEVYMPKAKLAGVEFIELSPAQCEAFKEQAAGVWDWWAEEVGKEKGEKIIELAQAAK